jgi:hypothetical protein
MRRVVAEMRIADDICLNANVSAFNDDGTRSVAQGCSRRPERRSPVCALSFDGRHMA